MNGVNFNKGAILLGENNHPKDGKHYIVYYDDLDGIDFIGAMIKTKSYSGENISMQSDHFEEKDSTGNNWQISYNGSYIVPAKLRKFNEMGYFTQVGQLTQKGIDFMKSALKDKDLITWADYTASRNVAE